MHQTEHEACSKDFLCTRPWLNQVWLINSAEHSLVGCADSALTGTIHTKKCVNKVRYSSSMLHSRKIGGFPCRECRESLSESCKPSWSSGVLMYTSWLSLQVEYHNHSKRFQQCCYNVCCLAPLDQVMAQGPAAAPTISCMGHKPHQPDPHMNGSGFIKAYVQAYACIHRPGQSHKKMLKDSGCIGCCCLLLLPRSCSQDLVVTTTSRRCRVSRSGHLSSWPVVRCQPVSVPWGLPDTIHLVRGIAGLGSHGQPRSEPNQKEPMPNPIS